MARTTENELLAAKVDAWAAASALLRELRALVIELRELARKEKEGH